jgi:CheY-like chemotaxis protein
MTLAACTVLVVEDHEFQRRTMLQILANLGVGDLLEAADGEEALEVMATRAPEVVLCDLDMPGMDGIGFFEHLAHRGLDPALIIASGLDEEVVLDAEATARELGLRVLGVVRKPLTARRLLELFAPRAATRTA